MTASPQAGGGLLPCPFCGSDDIVIVGVGHDHFARCDSCGVETPGGYGGKEGYPDRKNWVRPHPSYNAQKEPQAVAAWNRRASTPAPSGLAGEAVAKPFAWAIDAKFKSGGGCSGEFRDEAKALSEAARLRALDHTEDVRLTPLYAVPPSIPAGGVREALIDRVLDAAGDYMSEQYGNTALHHPTDRARIKQSLATLSLPAGGVAVSDAKEAVDFAENALAGRGQYYVLEEAIKRLVPLVERAYALSPEAKTGERS